MRRTLLAQIFADRQKAKAQERHPELVRAFLDTAPEIRREEATELVGVAPNQASRILDDPAREGWLLRTLETEQEIPWK